MNAIDHPDQPDQLDPSVIDRRPVWTLADVLSNPRYWILLVALLLGAAALRSFFSVWPMVASRLNAGYEIFSLFSGGSMAGWAVGGLLALLIMPRWPRACLMAPLLGFGLGMAGLLIEPQFWSWGPYLAWLGLCVGVLAMLALVAFVSLLASVVLPRTDMIQAVALPVALVSTLPELAVVGAYGIMADDAPLHWLALGLLIATLLALLALALLRPLALQGAARRRLRPLSYRQRSPWTIGLVAVLPGIVAFLLWLGTLLTSAMPVYVPLVIVLGLIGLASAAYVSYWVYRIHGEAAGLSPSPQWVSPLAGLLIFLLVPLGFALVLITLGRVLAERDPAQAHKPSYGWLAFWCLFAPPVAMAMIQSAVNRQAAGLRAG